MYLVTGATGFVGRTVVKALLDKGHNVVGVARKSQGGPRDARLNWHFVNSIDSSTEWQSALAGVTTVIHCAARVHVKEGPSRDSLAAYREINVAGSLRLAREAAAAGVKRIVFLSSIGVNGNHSQCAITEADEPKPHNAYSISKLEAEEQLFILGRQAGLEITVIRPPLIYGPQASGNFKALINLVQLGLPMPLGAVNNLRSFIALENLVNFIILCADIERTPQAANQLFLIADDEDVSTATLLRRTAMAAGKSSRLIPIPPKLLKFCAWALGRKNMADSLLNNLQIDTSKAQTLLGWRAPITMENQLCSIFKREN